MYIHYCGVRWADTALRGTCNWEMMEASLVRGLHGWVFPDWSVSKTFVHKEPASSTVADGSTEIDASMT
jgi:hypothetical protein